MAVAYDTITTYSTWYVAVAYDTIATYSTWYVAMEEENGFQHFWPMEEKC